MDSRQKRTIGLVVLAVVVIAGAGLLLKLFGGDGPTLGTRRSEATTTRTPASEPGTTTSSPATVTQTTEPQASVTVPDASETPSEPADADDGHDYTAIDFEVVDNSGVTHRLSDYKGRLIVLNFWASWCPPCKAEMPMLNSWYEEIRDRDDIVFLAVDLTDGQRETREKADAYIQGEGFSFPYYYDEPGEGKVTAGELYFVQSIPTTWIITSDFQLFYQHRGMINRQQLDQLLDNAYDYQDKLPQGRGCRPMMVLMVFLEGILAFISPCILPMLPVYVIYLAGDETAGRRRRVINTLGFISGFTLIYIALGATATSIGRFLFRNQLLVMRISGIIMILLGLYYLGLFDRLRLALSRRDGAGMREQGPSMTERMMEAHAARGGGGFLRSLLFGLAFAVTWSACATAWVGHALSLAATQATVWHGIGLLFAFSMGLGVPFMLTALLYESMRSGLGFIRRHMGRIRLASGLFMIVIGLLMFFNVLGRYMSLFN